MEEKMEETKNVIVKENKMGVMPVNRLLITMSLPMMLSMLIQALYNIVDSIFVARISENALTAVSLAFPAQNLLIGIGVGTGVGVNALLSKSLGEKRQKYADKVAQNAVFLMAMSYLVFAVIGLIFTRTFFEMQTDIAEIIDLGTDYLFICFIMSFGLFTVLGFEKLLQSTGLTMLSMVIQIIGAVINIILDPILIFGYFGLPAMGVKGAALATVIGQIIGGIIAIILNVKKNHYINLNFKGFRPSGEIIKRIYAVGVPTIIMNVVASFLTFIMNRILISFSSTANAVYGVYFKLQSFVFMPVFGLNNGMVPIVAYNYGAKNRERIVKTVKLSVIYACSIMAAGVLVFWLFTDNLLLLFDASENMLEIGRYAIRIISLSFVFAGFSIITGSVCQALSHGTLSMFVSLVRQIIVLLPVAYLLSRTGNLNAIWFAYPIAEIFSFTLSIILLTHIYRKEIKTLC